MSMQAAVCPSPLWGGWPRKAGSGGGRARRAALGPSAMPRTAITSLTRGRARALRNDMTKAEQVLWNALRPLKADGIRFRRQAPIGPFIADFACFQHRLVVEVDGHTHSTAQELERDARRTRFLEREGFVVYRCLNDDVFQAIDGVVMDIVRLTERNR